MKHCSFLELTDNPSSIFGIRTLKEVGTLISRCQTPYTPLFDFYFFESFPYVFSNTTHQMQGIASQFRMICFNLDFFKFTQISWLWINLSTVNSFPAFHNSLKIKYGAYIVVINHPTVYKLQYASVDAWLKVQPATKLAPVTTACLKRELLFSVTIRIKKTRWNELSNHVRYVWYLNPFRPIASVAVVSSDEQFTHPCT